MVLDVIGASRRGALRAGTHPAHAIGHGLAGLACSAFPAESATTVFVSLETVLCRIDASRNLADKSRTDCALAVSRRITGLEVIAINATATTVDGRFRAVLGQVGALGILAHATRAHIVTAVRIQATDLAIWTPATGAAATAVRVCLFAVLHQVRTDWSHAESTRADQACAVHAGTTRFVDVTASTPGLSPAAVGIGLVLILYVIAAGSSSACGTDAVPTNTIARHRARSISIAREANSAAAIQISFGSVENSVFARLQGTGAVDAGSRRTVEIDRASTVDWAFGTSISTAVDISLGTVLELVGAVLVR